MLAGFLGLGGPEVIAILVIIFLLFGAKKLPELARGLGKSLGEFKKAKKELEDELLTTKEDLEEAVKDDVKKPEPYVNPYVKEHDEPEKKDDTTSTPAP